MNRDHVVFAVCGFLLGLTVGSFLIGPKLAKSKLAGTSAVEMSADAPPESDPAATAASSAMPADAAGGASPMAAVRQELETLKKKIADNPKDFDALAQLANMYMDVGKFPQAIGYYQQALAAREEPSIRTDLGICYKQSGDSVKAAAEFTRVVNEAPDQWQALYNLAIIDIETKQIDRARTEIAKLKQMNADPSEVAKLEEAIGK